MRPFTLTLMLIVSAVPASAQTFSEYLALRKKNNISMSADAAALDAFVGTRTVEIKASAKGVIGSGDSKIIIVEGDGGRQYFVRCTQAPDWLYSNSVPARMLVSASRESESSRLEVELIGVASEQQMRDYEGTQVKASLPKSRPIGKGTATSRKGGRPSPMPLNRNETQSPVTGQIGGELPPALVNLIPEYTTFIQGQNKRLSAQQAQHIASTILAFSAHYGVDARLIMAIVLCESSFNPNSTSHAGAMGLGQLMPGTAKGLGITNAYDTEQNLYGTVRLIRGHIDKYTSKTGDSFEGLVLALAAYNAGSGAVRKYNGVPPYRETQNYVRKVVATYNRLCGN